jgi:hypothetical protein
MIASQAAVITGGAAMNFRDALSQKFSKRFADFR